MLGARAQRRVNVRVCVCLCVWWGGVLVHQATGSPCDPGWILKGLPKVKTLLSKAVARKGPTLLCIQTVLLPRISESLDFLGLSKSC